MKYNIETNQGILEIDIPELNFPIDANGVTREGRQLKFLLPIDYNLKSLPSGDNVENKNKK